MFSAPYEHAKSLTIPMIAPHNQKFLASLFQSESFVAKPSSSPDKYSASRGTSRSALLPVSKSISSTLQ